jgi:hypothetical protein
VCGERPKKPKPPSSGGTPSGGSASGGEVPTGASYTGQAASGAESPEATPRPPGQGRQGAEVYRAVTRVEGRHEELVEGERCPACGRGRVDRLPPGVERRLEGNALRSAVRSALEKWRGLWADLHGVRARGGGQGEGQCAGTGGVSVGAVVLGGAVVSVRELSSTSH